MKGIFTALINTFNNDGSPNLNALKKVIDYNINICGIDGLYVNGSTGEFFNLPHEYKKEFLRATAEHVAGRVDIIAQIGGNVIEEILELADVAGECNYNAISAVTPYYSVYSIDEIIAHYFKIADYSKLPLIIYNIPIRTGVVLTRDNFKTLLAHENISGVKFTSNDFYLLDNVRGDFPDKLLFSGFDEMLLSAAVLGTNGAIGTTYNIAGHWAKNIFEAVQVSDIKTAQIWQRKMNHVVGTLLNSGGFLSTIKAMFEIYGIENCGGCRLPMAPVGEKQREIAAYIVDYIYKNN